MRIHRLVQADLRTLFIKRLPDCIEMAVEPITSGFQTCALDDLVHVRYLGFVLITKPSRQTLQCSGAGPSGNSIASSVLGDATERVEEPAQPSLPSLLRPSLFPPDLQQTLAACQAFPLGVSCGQQLGDVLDMGLVVLLHLLPPLDHVLVKSCCMVVPDLLHSSVNILPQLLMFAGEGVLERPLPLLDSAARQLYALKGSNALLVRVLQAVVVPS
mmetsp:Transcript_102684/g.257407  ORF Transcript_102684/g.257407 Transcript_102684/m.257407 type:complete len:215 (-) Transcript_102684:484-1128(-)